MFYKHWESQYLVAVNALSQIQCMVCDKVLKNKKHNIVRHYAARHKSYANCEDREQIFWDLKKISWLSKASK